MYRWMKTNEVFAILNGPINQPLTELPYRLPHGSYILVQPTKERGWKNDGYSYIPRHNGVGTREDVEKLKINGKPVLVCSYSQTVSDTVSTQSLNRRIYKLIEGDSNVYLVHYLLSNPESAQNTQQEEIVGTNNPMEAPFFSDFLDGFAEPNFSNCNQLSSTNHANDDVLMQRIHQLEQRISYLEYEKTSYSTHKDSSDEFNFSFKEANQIKIMDYSPEWDYIDGGVKMMLCYQPIKELCDIQIVFGDHIVNATCIQPGVLKCIVPSNSAGKVHLQILQSGFSILDSDQPKEFEYKENKKQKKQKLKPRLMQKDEYREGEFKVRVIEKLTEFQQHCLQQQTQHSNDINIEQVLSPDNLNDSLMNTIIENCFQLADINNYDKFNEFLDSPDQHGFCLIHYLTVLEYQSTIKLLVKYGGNINLKGLDNLTPLQIAVMLQKEKMVGLLIQLGAIDQSYAEGDLQSVDQFFTLDQVCQNKSILDLLVRGVTLCDSIHNSSSMTEQSWNEQDDQEDAQFIKLTELMEGVNYNQSQVPQPKQDLKQARHKYLRSNKKHDFKVDSKNFAPDITYDEYADHVKVIQKNVRSWLLRRQYLDIKYATQVLQNYIRGKIIRKHMNPDCKNKIKSTLRNWLNLKD